MAYDATFHKSRASARRTRARRSRTRRRTARGSTRSCTRYPPDQPPVGHPARAVSGAGPAGLHHGERDAPRRRGARHARPPTSRTSSSYYTMFYTRPVGTFVLQRLPHAVVRAERRRARHRGARAKLGITPGETDRERHVHARRGRMPRRVRPRAGRHGERRAGTRICSRRTSAAARRSADARRSGADGLPSRRRGKHDDVTTSRRARGREDL